MAVELEVDRLVTVSTSHLTPQEGAAFNKANEDGSWYAALPGPNLASPMVWEYGWLFYIEGDYPPEEEGIGPGFAALIHLARKAGANWLRFDADGPVVAGVPTHSW